MTRILQCRIMSVPVYGTVCMYARDACIVLCSSVFPWRSPSISFLSPPSIRVMVAVEPVSYYATSLARSSLSTAPAHHLVHSQLALSLDTSILALPRPSFHTMVGPAVATVAHSWWLHCGCSNSMLSTKLVHIFVIYVHSVNPFVCAPSMHW